MTEKESSEVLKSSLGRLGVSRGQVIYLRVDMGKLPLPRWPAELNRDAITKRER